MAPPRLPFRLLVLLLVLLSKVSPARRRRDGAWPGGAPVPSRIRSRPGTPQGFGSHPAVLKGHSWLCTQKLPRAQWGTIWDARIRTTTVYPGSTVCKVPLAASRQEDDEVKNGVGNELSLAEHRISSVSLPASNSQEECRQGYFKDRDSPEMCQKCSRPLFYWNILVSSKEKI